MSDIYNQPHANRTPGTKPPASDLIIDEARAQTRRRIIWFAASVGIVLAILGILTFREERQAENPQLMALSYSNAPRVPATSAPPRITPMVDIEAELNATAPEKYAPKNVSPQAAAEAMSTLREAVRLVKERRFDEAETAVNKALAIAPGMNAAQRLLGMIYLQRGQFDQAIAALEESLRNDAFNPESYNNLAAAYMQKRLYDKSTELLKASLEIRPDYPAAHINLGLVAMLQGRHEQAVQSFQAVIDKIQENPSVRNNLGVALLRLGRMDEARAQFKTIMDKTPGNPAPFFNMAITFVLEQKNAEAMAWIRQGAALAPPKLVMQYLRDPDFDSVRETPDFLQLMQGLQPPAPVAPAPAP